MGSKSTTVQQADPWGPAQPYILQGLDAAQQMWNSNPNQFVIQPWEGPAVAQISDATGSAMTGIMANQPAQVQQIWGAQNDLNDVRGAAAGNHTTDAFNAGVQGAQNIKNSRSFNSGVYNAQNFGNTGAFNRAVGAAEGAGMTGDLKKGIGWAANLQRDNALASGISAAGSNPNAQWSNVMSSQMQGGTPASVSDAISANQGQGVSNPLTSGVAAAQSNALDPRFNRVVNDMTGGGYDNQLRESLRDNVRESVMPGMNATFAGSGMTGSSLHQANLAKSLASGMAGVESQFMDRAEDRRFAAAQAAQAADEAQRSRGLAAGQVYEGALSANRDQAMNAGRLGLQANQANQDNRFRSASAIEQERQNSIRNMMAAGQQGADDQFRRASLGLSAGQASQGVQDANLNRQLQAGQAAQSAAQSQAALGLQAGQAAQNAVQDQAALGLQAGQAAQNAFNANQAQALNAIGQQGALSQASFMPHQQALQVGQIMDDRNQTQLAADIMAHQQGQAAPIDALNNYMALTSGLGGQFGTSMSQSSQNPGLLGILGGISPLLGLLSDRRAKTDIRRVGTLDSGLPVYTYRYNGDPVTQMGVMAQDVAEVRPEAVSTRPDGMLQVHYDRIGDA